MCAGHFALLNGDVRMRGHAARRNMKKLFFTMMKFAGVLWCGVTPWEIYFDTITREVYKRPTFVGNWHGVIVTTFRSDTYLENRRREIMGLQQQVDAHDNCDSLAMVFRDISCDMIPIINSYIVTCYPPRLVPAPLHTLMSWSPTYDFSNITRGRPTKINHTHREKGCKDMECGVISDVRIMLEVLHCDKHGIILRDSDGIARDVTPLILLCINQLIFG